MTGALAGLAVGLQAEAEPPQQPPDQLLADVEATLGQGLDQVALASADPQQRCLGIAANGRLHQVGKRVEQAGLGVDLRLAAPAGAADTAGDLVFAIPQLRKAPPDCAACDARHRRHRCHTTPARRIGFAGRP